MDEPERRNESSGEVGMDTLDTVGQRLIKTEPMADDVASTSIDGPYDQHLLQSGYLNEECDLPVDIKDEYLSDDSSSSVVEWSSEPCPLESIPFKTSEELLVPAPCTPVDAFRMCFNNDLLDMIVKYTNDYADHLLKTGAIPNKRVATWRPTTREELLLFMSVWLHTGSIRISKLFDYWSKTPLFKLTAFLNYMSRSRFLAILCCLRFSPVEVNDRVDLIRPVIDHFNTTMKKIYNPGKNLSLERTWLLRNGRILFRPDLKKRTGMNLGITTYSLNSIGLALKLYVNIATDVSSTKMRREMAMDVLEDYLDKGHSIHTDVCFSSCKLAWQLLERNTDCTGILDRYDPHNPKEIKTRLRPPNDTHKSYYCNGVHVGVRRAGKTVHYLSTQFGNEMVEMNSRLKLKARPKVLEFCLTRWTETDTQDEMLAYYPYSKRSLKWYKRLFVHTMQLCLSNAFILYNTLNGKKKLTFYKFRLATLTSLLPANTRLAKTEPMVLHILRKIESEQSETKECHGCQWRLKRRVNTQYECSACLGNPGFCVPCFCADHTVTAF